MAERFKRISLCMLLLSICTGFGNRSYLESGYYLKYREGRNLFEKMTQFAVGIENGLKDLIKALREGKKHRTRRGVLFAHRHRC